MPSARGRARPVRPIVLGLVLAVAVLGATPASHAGVAAPTAPTTIVWGEGGVGVRAPARGRWVQATFDLAEGGALSLFARRRADGSLQVGPQTGSRARQAPAAAAAPGECADAAYVFGGGQWRQTLRWFFNPRGNPPQLPVADAEAAFRDGTRNVAVAYNLCGRPDAVRASVEYRGRAVHDPGIVGTLCLGADGINVVGWAVLPRPILAGTCNYGLGSELVESDVVFNNLVPWYRTRPGVCLQMYDLTAVATHERGHSLGLGHVAEETHPHLTMSTQTAACDGSASTLGLGDMLGLEALYP
ncbi:MAG: matrixin family metalloprotease [Actinomycetota bacterium]